MLLDDEKAMPRPIEEMNEQVINEVIGSIKTILKRSNGLYNFVTECRKLTKVPPPKTEQVVVKELIGDVLKLMQSGFKNRKINLTLKVESDDLMIFLDPNLIEQVLINLVKNAVEALGETDL